MMIGDEIGPSLRSMSQDMGIRMKIQGQGQYQQGAESEDMRRSSQALLRHICRICISMTKGPTVHNKMKVTIF